MDAFAPTNKDVSYSSKKQLESYKKSQLMGRSGRHSLHVTHADATQALLPDQSKSLGTVGHRRQHSTTKSQVSRMSRSSRRRLTIKGHESHLASKPRFNEDAESEARSIRQDAASAVQKSLKLNVMKNNKHERNSNRAESLSQTTALQSIRSSLSKLNN